MGKQKKDRRKKDSDEKPLEMTKHISLLSSSNQIIPVNEIYQAD